MKERSPRQVALVVATVGTALLATLGFVLWRTLPPLVPEAEHMAMRERPYTPVSDLPTVLEETNLNGIRFAILSNPETNRIRQPGYYDREIATWRGWLTEAGAVEVAVESAEVLVVPSGACLGAAARNQITYKLGAGGGVVSTDLMGAMDQECSPAADTLVTRLLGITSRDVAPADIRENESVLAVILGETLLGAHVPPGARIEMDVGAQYAFHVKNRDIFYTSYERAPRRVRSEPFFDAASARAQVGKGRYLAFGFDFQNLADDWSRRIMKNAMASGIRWAAGYPVVQVAPWPGGKKAAAVLAQDVEADFHNARNTVTMMKETGLPATAFIVGALAEADPRTMKMLAAYREIGSHTHDHLPLDTFSLAGQIRQLDKSKRVSEKLAGRAVLGLRPPQERFNAETLKIWADLGGDYVFGANNMRVAAPEIVPMEPDSLVLLARVSEDDFEILDRDKLRDLGLISSLLLTQVDEILALRGLYMFSFHSHMFAQKELVPIVHALAVKLKGTPDVWTTTAGEVARWWRARSHLRFEPQPNGDMAVRNAGHAPIEDVVLLIHKLDGSVARVPVAALQPGQSYTISATRAGRFTPPRAR